MDYGVQLLGDLFVGFGGQDGLAGLGLHLLLVDLLHVLTVVLLLQLFDQHGLAIRIVGVLLGGVGAELRERLAVEGVLNFPSLALLLLPDFLRFLLLGLLDLGLLAGTSTS